MRILASVQNSESRSERQKGRGGGGRVVRKGRPARTSCTHRIQKWEGSKVDAQLSWFGMGMFDLQAKSSIPTDSQRASKIRHREVWNPRMGRGKGGVSSEKRGSWIP